METSLNPHIYTKPHGRKSSLIFTLLLWEGRFPPPIRKLHLCTLKNNDHKEPKLPINCIFMCLIGGWGLIVPAPSRSPQNTVKVHNELGKVTKFETSKPLF